MEINEIYKQAIETFGKDAQLKMCIEEMAELTQAICKSFRGEDNTDNIVEEIADVEIMLAQIKIIYSLNKNEVCLKKADKIARLEMRLNNTAIINKR